jgi:hypothetical protein
MQEGYERRRRVRGVTPELLAAAKELRHRMTPAEQVLWRALQNRQLGGLRFRNQYPVGPFVLDFYCPHTNWSSKWMAAFTSSKPSKTPPEQSIWKHTAIASCVSTTTKC